MHGNSANQPTVEASTATPSFREGLLEWALSGGVHGSSERMSLVLEAGALEGSARIADSDDPSLARDLLLLRCVRLARTGRRLH